MPLPLLVANGNDAQTTWDTFVERRNGLTNRMQMHVCDGCDECGLRCMDGFTVSQHEWEAVQTYLASQPPEEVARVQTQVKTAPWPGAAESGVPEATVSYCPFRDMEKGNCSIYPVRPTVCRLFGHTSWLPCPIGAVTRYPEGAPELWGEYRTFERRTFVEWQARKEKDF